MKALQNILTQLQEDNEAYSNLGYDGTYAAL